MSIPLIQKKLNGLQKSFLSGTTNSLQLFVRIPSSSQPSVFFSDLRKSMRYFVLCHAFDHIVLHGLELHSAVELFFETATFTRTTAELLKTKTTQRTHCSQILEES